MREKIIFAAAALACAMLLGGPALAVPPNTDLLSCDNITVPAEGEDGHACFEALKTLCTETRNANFKKQMDEDTLVSKTVGAAFKIEQGKIVDATVKLEQYGEKLSGLGCYPDDNKWKVSCDDQENLNTLLIAAQSSCGL